MLGRGQMLRILNALCIRSGLASRGARWNGPGDGRPSDEVLAFASGKRGFGCSSGESTLLQVALDVFNGHGHASVHRLLHLDNENLAMIGELLTAIAEGEAAAERWIAKYSHAALEEAAVDRVQAEGEAKLVARECKAARAAGRSL